MGNSGHSRGHHGQRPPLPQPLPVPVADNHTHLDIARDGSPAVDVAQAIADAASVGVDRMVQIGCDLPSARFTASVVEQHPELLGGAALHPNEVPKLAERGELEDALAEIERLMQGERMRVVGETGLDYFRTGADGVAVQIESFRWHIDLAKRLGKALQIHDRDAHDDVMRVLAEEGAPERTVLHCFSGDVAMARECVERGYYISVAGVVTFKNARDLREALAQVPLERLMVETDAPYLTPAPYRGATNSPYLVPLTVRALAELKNVSVGELCEILSRTTEDVYGRWS